LGTAIRKSIELARIIETSAEVIQNWYNVLFQTIDELDISWNNTYNCDESGFGLGKRKAIRVIDNTIQQNYQAEPGRQEWVSYGMHICRRKLDSTVKGENVCQRWMPKELPEGWLVSCNSKGWTSNIHGLEWLRKCFEPFRLLICDGHNHISAEFIRHCIANRIVLLLLPLLQLLWFPL
jgi:hypothetical protein